MKIMERTPMQRIHITAFAQKFGQREASVLLKITQGALSKAIRRGRDIYVTEQPDGSFTAEEVRSFPSQNPEKQQLSEPISA